MTRRRRDIPAMAGRDGGAPGATRRGDDVTHSGLPVQSVYTPLDLSRCASTEELQRYTDQARAAGRAPFTRGIRRHVPRGQLGHGACTRARLTPTETNQRIRSLLSAGQTGFSVALDLPTQLGLDSDHPLAQRRGRPGRRAHRLPGRHGRAPQRGGAGQGRADPDDRQLDRAVGRGPLRRRRRGARVLAGSRSR